MAEFMSEIGLVTALEDTIYFIDKSAPPEAAAGDCWGSSVSLSADGMAFIAGAPGRGSGLSEGSGAACYCGRPDALADWSSLFFDAGVDARASARFGWSVSLSGNSTMIAVGAPGHTAAYIECGSVFLFSRSGPPLDGETKTSPGVAVKGWFGASVALAHGGDIVLAGASGEKDEASASSGFGGRAYGYRYSGGIWGSVSAIDPPAGLNNNDNYGFAVALSGDGTTAAIGAYGLDFNGLQDSGSVYIYTFNGSWTHNATLVPPVAGEFGFFGNSVSLNHDGTRCAIGARGEGVGSRPNQGAAYVYSRTAGGNTWAQESRVLAPDGAADDYFGTSLSLSSDGMVLAAGAPAAGGAFSRMGAVYAFRKVQDGVEWDFVEKFMARDGSFQDMLGSSLSCSADGRWIAAGAPYDDEDGLEDRGSVYVFNLD
jgi:hypothetical protein